MSDAEKDELFTSRMRKATRKIHSVSDALVNAKFAISLRDEKVWGGGLFVFYHIFAYLEDAKQRLNMPDFNNLFIHQILHRKKAFEEDLAHYLGDDWQSTPKSRALENYLQHLQDLEKDNPSLLMAYVYHLYLGLLSGGQILAKKRRFFGETLETTPSPEPHSELGTLSVETQNNIKDQEIDMAQEEIVLEILENATKIASSLTKSDSEKAVSSLKAVTDLPLFNNEENPIKASESIESLTKSDSEKEVSPLKAVIELPLFNNVGNPTIASESIESEKPTSAPNRNTIITEEKKAELREKRRLRKQQTQQTKLQKQQKELLLVNTPGNEATCSPTTVIQTNKSTSLTEVTYIPETASENNIAVSSPICENILNCSDMEQGACSEKTTLSSELGKEKQITDVSKNNSLSPSNVNDSIPNEPSATINLDSKESSNLDITYDLQQKLEDMSKKQTSPSNIQNSDTIFRLLPSENTIHTETPVKPANSKFSFITKTPVKLASCAIVQDVLPTPLLSNSQSKKKTRKEKRVLAMLAANNQENSDCAPPAKILKRTLKIEHLIRQDVPPTPFLSTSQSKKKTKKEKRAIAMLAANNQENSDCAPPAKILKRTLKIERLKRQMMLLATALKRQSSALRKAKVKNYKSDSRNDFIENVPLGTINLETKRDLTSGPDLSTKTVDAHPVILTKSQSRKRRRKERLAILAAENQQQNCNGAPVVGKQSKNKRRQQNNAEKQRIADLAATVVDTENHQCFALSTAKNKKPDSQKKPAKSSNTGWLLNSFPLQDDKDIDEQNSCFVPVAGSNKRKRVTRMEDSASSTTLTFSLTASMERMLQQSRKNMNQKASQEKINVMKQSTLISRQSEPTATETLTSSMNTRASTITNLTCSQPTTLNQHSSQRSWTNANRNVDHIDTVNVNQEGPSKVTNKMNNGHSTGRAINSINKQSTLISCTKNAVEMYGTDSTASGKQQNPSRSWYYPSESALFPDEQICTKSSTSDKINESDTYSKLTSNCRHVLPDMWTNKMPPDYPTDCVHIPKSQQSNSKTWIHDVVYQTDYDLTSNYLQDVSKSWSNKKANNYPTDGTHKNQHDCDTSCTNRTTNVYHTESDQISNYRRQSPDKHVTGRSLSENQQGFQKCTDELNDRLSGPMSNTLNLDVPLNSRTNYTVSDHDANLPSTSNKRQNHPKLWIESNYSPTNPPIQEGPLKLMATDILSMSSSMDQQNPNTEEGEEYNDLNDECCVAVTTSPFHELSEEQAEYIRFRVEVASDKVGSNPQTCETIKAPSFRKVLFQDRVIKYWCEDYYTVDWLRRSITSVRSTCPGNLVVCKQSEIPKIHEIFIIVPNEQGKSIEDLILKMKKQNVVSYDIESWSLRQVKQIGLSEQFKRVLIFEVPLEEWVKLKRFGRIFYNLGELDVFFDDASLASALHEQANLNTEVPQIPAKKKITRQQDTEERIFLNRRRPGDSIPYSNIPEKIVDSEEYLFF